VITAAAALCEFGLLTGLGEVSIKPTVGCGPGCGSSSWTMAFESASPWRG
jgi:hypothetical protein